MGMQGSFAEYIAPGGSSDIIEKSIDVQTVICNAQNVSTVIDESLIYATKEDLENIVVPVTSVNSKTGDITLTTEDVGAETPEGAQTKATAALNSAKGYTDEEATETRGLIGTIANLATTIKDNLVAAINEIFNDLKTHKADNANPHNVDKVDV